MKQRKKLSVNLNFDVVSAITLFLACLGSLYALITSTICEGKEAERYVCNVEEADLADQAVIVYTVKVPDDETIQSVSAHMYLLLSMSGISYLVPVKAKQMDYRTSKGDILIQMQSPKQLIKLVAEGLGVGVDRVQMKPCLEIEDQDGEMKKYLLASGELLSWDEAVPDVISIDVSLDITDEDNLQQEIKELFTLMF